MFRKVEKTSIKKVKNDLVQINDNSVNKEIPSEYIAYFKGCGQVESKRRVFGGRLI